MEVNAWQQLVTGGVTESFVGTSVHFDRAFRLHQELETFARFIVPGQRIVRKQPYQSRKSESIVNNGSPLGGIVILRLMDQSCEIYPDRYSVESLLDMDGPSRDLVRTITLNELTFSSENQKQFES